MDIIDLWTSSFVALGQALTAVVFIFSLWFMLSNEPWLKLFVIRRTALPFRTIRLLYLLKQLGLLYFSSVQRSLFVWHQFKTKVNSGHFSDNVDKFNKGPNKLNSNKIPSINPIYYNQ